MQIGAVHEDYSSDHQTMHKFKLRVHFVKPGLICFMFISYAIMIQARVE